MAYRSPGRASRCVQPFCLTHGTDDSRPPESARQFAMRFGGFQALQSKASLKLIQAMARVCQFCMQGHFCSPANMMASVFKFQAQRLFEAQVAAGHDMKELGVRMEQSEFKAQHCSCFLSILQYDYSLIITV